jgi:hypothetical protein
MSTLQTTNLKNPSSGSNNIVLNTDGSSTLTRLAGGAITSGTSVASTSGVSIDFTGIPSWVKRVTVMFNGVSKNGTSAYLFQLGTSVGIENTGYVSKSAAIAVTGNGYQESTAGFILYEDSAGVFLTGQVSITLFQGATFVATHTVTREATVVPIVGAGKKTLSTTLDRVRITTVNGTDTFDAGSINIMYEG